MKKEHQAEIEKIRRRNQAKLDAKYNAIFAKLTLDDLKLLLRGVARENELRLQISRYIERDRGADEAFDILWEIFSKI